MLMTMTTNSRILRMLAILLALSVLPSCKQSDGGTVNESPGTGVETGNGDTASEVPSSSTFEPIQLNSEPLDQTGFAGQTVQFSVAATSNIALRYQWFHNDAAIKGATSNKLSVTISGSASAGTYRVDVSNASTRVSSSAGLEVGTLPQITSQPSSLAVYPGDAAVLSVVATGSNLGFAWEQLVNGSWKSVAGITTSTLLVASVDAAKATQYRAKVSNAGGSVTSSAATISLKQPVVITQQPVARQAGEGQSVTFTVRANGHGLLYYRWYKGKYAIYDSTKYSGTSIPTLTINNVTAADASLYQVKVFNDDKKYAFSATAQLSVAGPAKVTVQPENTTLYSGKSGSLFIAASGDQPMSYQWQKWSGSAWQNVGGATSAALNFASVTSTTAGRYRCQVSNAVAQDTSAEASVTVLQGVSITRSPASTAAKAGDSVQFSITATGDNLNYEWTKNGQVISGTASTLAFASVKEVDEATYGCRVYNGGGSVACSSFTLTVNSPLTITRQPVTQNTYEGGSATLSVEASGDPAPTVEWYFSGALVGTGNSLTLNNIKTSQAGDYQCVVKNSSGSINCNVASIVVSNSVKITGQPSNTTANEGAALTLTMSASGENLNYEWSRNGVSLGVNSNSLSFASVKASDEGTYSCRIWNSNSSANCNNFTLSVNQGVTITKQPVAASAFEDGTVTLSVAVTGKPVPTVNWYFNGQLVQSATSTLTLNKITMSQAGSYQCIATNSVNSTSCAAVTVTVREKVRITKQLSNQLLNDGDDIVLNLSATGEAPINYQCYQGTKLVVASTNVADLVIPDTGAADSGNYRCVASNAGSSATTGTVAISITAAAASKSAILSWTQPTKRANGENLSASEIAGYEIYMATSAGGAFSTVMTTGPGETQALITELVPGEYYFGITTLDTNGLESGMSSVSKVTIE